MQQHIGYAVLDLDTMKPFKGNARKHDDQVLSNSVKAHGQYRTLVVRVLGEDPQNPDEYVLIAGHGTAEALRSRGQTMARVELMVCSDEEALAINLVDNRSNDVAFYDDDLLAAQLEEAQAFHFEGTGWDEAAAKKILEPDTRSPGGGEPPDEVWAIIVEARNEEHQVELLRKFEEEGLTCRPLIA